MIERLTLAIAAGAALSVGCGDRTRTVDVGDDDGETSAGTSTTQGWGEESSSSASTGAEEGDMDPRFDIGGIPDTTDDPPPGPECEPNDGPGEFACEDPQPGSIAYLCIPPPIAGEPSCESYDVWQVVDLLRTCTDSKGCEGPQDVACGPDPGQQELCCYWVEIGFICPGRPFMVGARARLAAIVRGPGWAWRSRPHTADLDAVTRTALADAWSEQASFEHAAVASFARFCLQLLAVGAPPRLVAAAQRAGEDELAHARAFLGLASAYAGCELAPGPLDVSGSLEDTALAAVAAATAAEGCIAETVSLLQLEAARRACRDPAVESTLERIAAQELAHVELAWSFVAWALERGTPDVRLAVEHVFVHAPRHVARGPRLDPRADAAALARHGQPGAAVAQAVADRCLREIVTPCARRLLRAPAKQVQRGPDAAPA